MARTPAATRSMPFDNLFWRSSSSAFRSRARSTRPNNDDAAKRRYWPTTSAYVVSWWRNGGAKSPRPTVVNVITAKYAALPNVIPNHHDVTTVTKRMYLHGPKLSAYRSEVSDAAAGPAVPN